MRRRETPDPRGALGMRALLRSLAAVSVLASALALGAPPLVRTAGAHHTGDDAHVWLWDRANVTKTNLAWRDLTRPTPTGFGEAIPLNTDCYGFEDVKQVDWVVSVYMADAWRNTRRIQLPPLLDAGAATSFDLPSVEVLEAANPGLSVEDYFDRGRIDVTFGCTHGEFNVHFTDWIEAYPKFNDPPPPGGGNLAPTASFDALPTGEPGAYQFVSTSTDPEAGALREEWDFGDGTTASGRTVTHTFSTPGEHRVGLRVLDPPGLEDSEEQTLTVDAPALGLTVELLDGASPPLDPDGEVGVRVTASASSDGVGSLQQLRFTDDEPLTWSPEEAFGPIGDPDPVPPPEGFELAPGEQRSFEARIKATALGRYSLRSALAGVDEAGAAVEASAQAAGEVGQPLRVVLTADPPFADQEEGDDGPEPVDVTVTIDVTNTTAEDMTDVTLTSLRVDRTRPGQLLAVSQTGGVRDWEVLGSLGPGETRQLTATFRATDDAEVEFEAVLGAQLPGGGTETAVGKTRWSVRPEYLVELDTVVTRPPANTLLPAGDLIRVTGFVRNLSNTATLELGPLYPELAGNAGVMSLTYDAVGADPKALEPAAPLVLDPGESTEFSVRILTSWSDPRRIEGDNRHGGTWAELTFTPWGTATLEDGTVVDITEEQIKAEEQDLNHRVSIDDSIELPAFDRIAYAQAIMLGAIEGTWSATVATLWSFVDVLQLPYTTIRATTEFQTRVWGSFTPEEKEALAADAGLLAASVLMRNAEMGKRGAAELYEMAKSYTLQAMTEMENEWQIGDYTSTTRLYARYGADAIGQVVVPLALVKLAKSPAAAAALTRAHEALQARMRSHLSSVLTIERLEQVVPVLEALESGTELLPEQLAVLYGITPEELVELQKLADEFNFLLTVRSRHQSSIEWIRRGAMLKPETLKIKSVSELDIMLGYRPSDLGSLVFRKPEVLTRFEAGEGSLGSLLNEFVTSKGFVPGTGEWENAVYRVMARVEEWQKWEGYYKYWSERQFIEVSLNYKGNGIYDPIRKGPSSLGLAPLESGKYVGFRLEPIGDGEFVVQIFDAKAGRWARVTGDIDPLAFTHLDGSPLTAVEHAALLDRLATDPALRAQHGESATFVKGGVEFVASQMKPGEPALQIAPGGHLPRVVRLNKEKSRWSGPRDYHLHWDGGFVYSGSFVPRGAVPAPARVVPPKDALPAPKPRPLPKAVGAEPNVGRCRVSYSTTSGAKALMFDDRDRIVELVEGALAVSPLDEQCFAEGPTIEVSAMPATGVASDAVEGAEKVEIPEGGYEQFLASAAGGELQVGQEVVVGAGTDHAEVATIAGFGSIVLRDPLQHDHAAGELVVVTRAAPAPTSASPTTTVPTSALPPTGQSVTPSSTVPSTTGAGGSSEAVSGGSTEVASESSGGESLAVTGSGRPAVPLAGAIMTALGLALIVYDRTRRHNRVHAPANGRRVG